MSTPSEHQVGGKTAKAVFPDPKTAALAIAACVGDAAGFKAALRSGGNPNGEGFEGVDPLMWAEDCENVAGVKMLLEAGANPNPERLKNGPNPVLVAAEKSNSEILKLLLQHGGDPNASYNGNSPETALIIAFSSALDSDNWDNYYLLLNGGANINRVHYGQTIAEWAAGLSRYDKVYELLERGYSTNLLSIGLAAQNANFPAYAVKERADVARVKAKLRELGVKFPVKPSDVPLLADN